MSGFHVAAASFAAVLIIMLQRDAAATSVKLVLLSSFEVLDLEFKSLNQLFGFLVL